MSQFLSQNPGKIVTRHLKGYVQRGTPSVLLLFSAQTTGIQAYILQADGWRIPP